MAISEAAVRAVYPELLRVARRCSGSAVEARDLVQDALEIALSRGFDDWASPSRRAWLRGVVRRRAAFLARGQARRRRREQATEHPASERGRWAWHPQFIASLPRSLRTVAALVSADLSTAEIRSVLGLSAPAFRQRLSALRRAVRAQPERPTVSAPAPGFWLGAGRAHLLATLRRKPGSVLATHDPDGHPILLCTVAHETRGRGNS